MHSHFLLLLIYSFAVTLFFTFLWKDAGRERSRFFLILFAAMVGASVFVAWIMYPLPV